MKPLELPPNLFHRFYRGGPRIDRLRGLPPGSHHRPEDWVGSTATTFGEATEGLSRLADGRLVRDVIAADPGAWLGAEHVARHGADPALLVKLLDAGERLGVHAHPGRAFAREHLGLERGKTEAWIIVEAEPDAAVHVGLREPVDAATLRAWVDAQDVDAMLGALRRRTVRAGDAILVPSGTLHAIGEGILLVELQEPTDLSVMLEHARFGMDSGLEHLHLGWDVALEAVDREPPAPLAAPAPAADTIPPTLEDLLGPDAAPYFRAQRLRPAGGDVELEPSFAILMPLRGHGTLSTERGDRLALAPGLGVLVPHGAGTTSVDGDVDAIRCLPPAPAAGEGRW